MVLKQVREALLPKKASVFIAPAILLILLLYFYTNGAIIFGTLWGGFEKVILLYIIILLAAFGLAPKLLTFDPKAPLYWELAAYIGPAIAVNFAILILGLRQDLGPTSPGNSIPVIALQIAISGSEEMFFRGALWHRSAGPLISSVAFAGFHAVAYGLNPINLVIAFGAGFAFYIIYESTRAQYGLAVNSGIHLGYNLALLGVSLIPFGLLGA